MLDDERDDVPVARMGVIAERSGAGAEGLTLASAWQAISGSGFTDELLAWPPDVFALTNVLRDRSEAFRFALSPPAGVHWPPAGAGGWSDAVVDAGREWSAWVEDRRGSVPSMVAEEWGVALQRADRPLADLAAGRDWRVCQALLSLHAIADEACQNKHHRWSLDENQIYQYHLAGALHPQVRWWETMDVPPRSLQLVSVCEEITIVSLVCQDLAETDEIADVIRSVGPTVVLAVLLDGPQLASRWAARYASVFADDPGSVVPHADLVRDGAAEPPAGASSLA